MDVAWHQRTKDGSVSFLTEGDHARCQLKLGDEQGTIIHFGRVSPLYLYRQQQLLDRDGVHQIWQMFMGRAMLHLIADPTWYLAPRDQDECSFVMMQLVGVPAAVKIGYADLRRLADAWDEYEPVMRSVWPGHMAAQALTVLRAGGVRYDLSLTQQAINQGWIEWHEDLAPYRLCSPADWPECAEAMSAEAQRLARLVGDKLLPECLSDMGVDPDDAVVGLLSPSCVMAAYHAAAMGIWYLGASRARRFGPLLTFAGACQEACRALPGRQFCGPAVEWMIAKAPAILGLEVTNQAAFARSFDDVLIDCDGYLPS